MWCVCMLVKNTNMGETKVEALCFSERTPAGFNVSSHGF
jgi:hypothetical protein